MEIDWSIVLHVLMGFQFVTFTTLIVLSIVSRKWRGQDRIDRTFGPLLGLLPIIGQAFVFQTARGIIATYTEKVKDIPPKAIKICDAVIAKEDFEILRNSVLYNKALDVTIGTDEINVGGHKFYTTAYGRIVKNVLYDRKFDSMLEMYNNKKSGA